MLQKLNSNISNNIQANEHLQWFKSGVEEARKQDVKLLAMQLSVITQEDSWMELFNCRDTIKTHHMHVFTVSEQQTIRPWCSSCFTIIVCDIFAYKVINKLTFV